MTIIKSVRLPYKLKSFVTEVIMFETEHNPIMMISVSPDIWCMVDNLIIEWKT